MKLFSKRNAIGNGMSFSGRYSIPREKQILSSALRNRLISQVAFLTSRDDFLEFFILFENQKKDKKFLDKWKVDGFSLAELGYKFSDYFEFEDFAMKVSSYDDPHTVGRGTRETVVLFNDYALFDLLEFIVLFSKNSKRNEVTNRFNDIFIEENTEFELVNWTIVKQSWEDIFMIKNLLKDQKLKKKIEDFKYYWDSKDYVNTAKISIEMINIIFSSESWASNNKTTKKILEEVSDANVLDQQKKETLYNYLNSVFSTMKWLSNDIYNIRHTEKTTISLLWWEKNVIYKLISLYNLSLVELTLLSKKEEFLFSEDWESVKDAYIHKYQINKNQRLIIKKVFEDDLELPF